MEDTEIIGLYIHRDEQAIRETIKKYKSYGFRIAVNILQNRDDAEECLNDSWNTIWNRVPPLLPNSLKAFIGKVVRDHALGIYRKNHAKKRFCAFELLLSEVDECIPDSTAVEQIIEEKRLTQLLNQWLRLQKKEDTLLFIRRYYYGESVKDLAREHHCSENMMSQRLKRLRNRLKAFLKKEDVEV